MTDQELKAKIDRAARDFDSWPVMAQEALVRGILCRAQVEHEIEFLRLLHGTYLPEGARSDVFRRIDVLSKFPRNLDDAATGLAGSLGFAGISMSELRATVAVVTTFGEMPNS